MATPYKSGFTSGNFAAFARPRKPPGVEDKTATFVGSGIASLAGAVFLIRDGHMKGDKITIIEMDRLMGGALDGNKEPSRGFVIRGGRELEDHYECLWDLFRSIPTLEDPDVSVLDEVFYLNKDDHNHSLCRVTHQCGQDAGTQNKFNMSKRATRDVLKLFLATREDMEGKRIDEVVSKDFLESNFWLYWQTMFGYEHWHSALEMKLYLHRFIHHIKGLPDLSTIMFTRYNQYESFVLPLLAYLKKHGVKFLHRTRVTDIEFKDEKQATKIVYDHLHDDGSATRGSIALGPNDLVFITNGSLVDNSDNGDHHTPAKLNTGPSLAWDLWRRIAAQSPSGKFGRPDVFGSHIEETKWESCTVTCHDSRIPEYIKKICHRDAYTGKIVTGGIVTVKDSNWLLSWTMNRQPHFKAQLDEHGKLKCVVAWVYGLYVDTPGNYVKKTMQEATGEEIVQEWLYHMGVPEHEIQELAATAATAVPTMMPYVTSFFMPRHKGDRPDVIPEGAVNFAFLGQFAETKSRDCVFTTEYSVRTAMEAVYGHLKIERSIPEVFNSTYDARTVLAAITALRDGEPFDIPGPAFIRNWVFERLQSTSLGEVIVANGVTPEFHREEKEAEH